VNRALHEAVALVTWSAEPSVYKTIFLVGDCPPHMDYTDDVKYPKTCEAAARKGIIINTVQCGNQTDTTPVWRAISDLAEGRFVAIEQSGGMQVVATPVDGDLARSIGSWAQRSWPTATRLSRRRSGPSRWRPRPRPPRRLRTGSPTTWRRARSFRVAETSWTGGQRRRRVVRVEEGRTAGRDAEDDSGGARSLREGPGRQESQAPGEIDQLLAKRKAYVEEQLKKGGPKDSFDAQVESIIRAQAERKGIHYSPAQVGSDHDMNQGAATQRRVLGTSAGGLTTASSRARKTARLAQSVRPQAPPDFSCPDVQ